MAKYKMEDKGFLRGVIYSAALVYDSTGDSVTVKELIETLGGDLDFACKISDENDVIKLRQIIPNLPIGEGAYYSEFTIKSIDFDGNETADSSEIYNVIVYAIANNGILIELAEFPTVNEANDFYLSCAAWKKKQDRTN